MYQERVGIKTPEFVSLQFQLAGLGSRAAAFIIDQLILMFGNISIINRSHYPFYWRVGSMGF